MSSQWSPDTELGAAPTGLPRLSRWCCLHWEGTPRPAGQTVERKSLESWLPAGRSLHAETLPSCSSLSSSHTQNPLPPRVRPRQDLRGKGSLVRGSTSWAPGPSQERSPPRRRVVHGAQRFPAPIPPLKVLKDGTSPFHRRQEQRHRALSCVTQPGFEPGSTCFQTPRMGLPPGRNGQEVP